MTTRPCCRGTLCCRPNKVKPTSLKRQPHLGTLRKGFESVVTGLEGQEVPTHKGLRTDPTVRIGRVWRGQNLERHVAAEAQIAGAEDFTHPALAQPLGDLVVRDLRAGHTNKRLVYAGVRQ